MELRQFKMRQINKSKLRLMTLLSQMVSPGVIDFKKCYLFKTFFCYFWMSHNCKDN